MHSPGSDPAISCEGGGWGGGNERSSGIRLLYRKGCIHRSRPGGSVGLGLPLLLPHLEELVVREGLEALLPCQAQEGGVGQDKLTIRGVLQHTPHSDGGGETIVLSDCGGKNEAGGQCSNGRNAAMGLQLSLSSSSTSLTCSPRSLTSVDAAAAGSQQRGARGRQQQSAHAAQLK